MYRFLLTRQWLILALVALLLIPAMVELGFWQLHRHERKVAGNERIADALSAPAAPVGTLTSPGGTVPEKDRYRPVTASGTYDTAHEVVVRQRTGRDKNRVGFHVLTPLVLSDGTAVLVDRGWIPPTDDLTAYPEVPAAPRGKVTVTGLLLPDETTASSGIKKRSGLPDRQVMLINSEEVPLDRPLNSGYIQLRSTSPRPAGEQPETLPEPDHGSIGPHLAYAFNWWLLAAGVPVGWVILVRRELRDRAAASGHAASGHAASGTTPAAAVPGTDRVPAPTQAAATTEEAPRNTAGSTSA